LKQSNRQRIVRVVHRQRIHRQRCIHSNCAAAMAWLPFRHRSLHFRIRCLCQHKRYSQHLLYRPLTRLSEDASRRVRKLLKKWSQQNQWNGRCRWSTPWCKQSSAHTVPSLNNCSTTSCHVRKIRKVNCRQINGYYNFILLLLSSATK
jgi:hypothetical protein